MQTFIVDSFTDKPFSGNPAGVCLVDRPVSDKTMLSIAQELGLSETAFVQPLENNENWSIRFFSPVMEVPLCGHATLASARILFDDRSRSSVTFVNKNALHLAATIVDEQITMELPHYQTQPCDAPAALVEALQIDELLYTAYNAETSILMLELSSVEELAGLQPDFAKLLQSHSGINGVLVTAASYNDEYDFHSRYFWPWSGTNEDPVTGATHTFLAPYWGTKLNKSKMRSFQASKRTGHMSIELLENSILISGQAQIVFRGRLELPDALF